MDPSPSALEDMSATLRPVGVETDSEELPEDTEPPVYPLETEATFTTSMKGATMHEEYYAITAKYSLDKTKLGKGGIESILKARVCTFLAGLTYYVLQAGECIYLLEYDGVKPASITRALDLPDFGNGLKTSYPA